MNTDSYQHYVYNIYYLLIIKYLVCSLKVKNSYLLHNNPYRQINDRKVITALNTIYFSY